MKKSLILVLLVIICGVSIVIINFSTDKEFCLLKYNKGLSSHGSFVIKDGYVTIKDNIYVKNQTAKDIYFCIIADMDKDYGLVTDKKVQAYEEDSFIKKKYCVKANSEGVYPAYFKSRNGDENTKMDRLPPDNVEFEIVEIYE